MKNVLHFRLAIGVSIVTGVLSCSAQTRRPQAARPPVTAPAHVAEILTPVQSLRGIKRMSIDLYGWGSDTASMRDSLGKLLQQSGVDVLPEGSYPILRLYYQQDTAEFSTGDISTPFYRERRVRGVVITLAVDQLFPLGSDSVPGVTYRQTWTKVGFNVDTNQGTKQVVQQFLTDLIGDSRDSSDVLIKQTIGPTNRLEAYEPSASELSAEDKARAHQQENEVFFGTPRPQALVCYYSAGMRFFWYKTAPANAEAAYKAMPNGPLKNIGYRALDACPANLAAEKEAQKTVTK